MILFKLPAELIHLTLSFLSADELTRLFDLNQVLYCHPKDSYVSAQHIALLQKFSNKNLIISNDETLVEKSRKLSIIELEYLTEFNLIIKPKDISFILFNFCGSINTSHFIDLIFNYLEYLKLATDNFNIQLVLLEDKCTEDFIKPFNNFNINWLTIKLTSSYDISNCTAFMSNSSYLRKISVQNLRLQLFNSNNLISHLNTNKHCHLYSNLKTLDLSYNGLNDLNLSSVKFPPSLNSLNISNNNLYYLNSSNFRIAHLKNLRALDISNNSLLSISFNNESHSVNLKSLNASGNNLNNYMFLESTFFNCLLEVDLSRNLISNLSKFPRTLIKINLCGNLLNSNQLVYYDYFPNCLAELNLSWCKFHDSSLETTHSILIKFAKNFPKLRILELNGNSLNTERNS